MILDISRQSANAEKGVVLTKAVLRAADRLGVTAKSLATIIGVSKTTVSRMKKGDYVLETSTKSFELSVLFVRLFRSLDAIVGGDESVAQSWLRNPNALLDGKPIEKIRTIAGLMDVIAYLDSRRALV